MSGYRKYAVILGLLFVVFVVVEYYRPKPIDWKQTFSNKDKIPYGTYVLFELLPDLFKQQAIESVRLPILNQLEDSTHVKSNYIFINNNFALDSLDLLALLDYVKAGNQVFISAEQFPKVLRDTLDFDTDFSLKPAGATSLLMTSGSAKQKKFPGYEWDKVSTYFKTFPKTNRQIIGKTAKGNVNFLQIPFGNGNFYLNTVPLAFCNYHVLSETGATYAATALSHLPVQPVLWDEYQKQGRFDNGSMFQVLVSHEPLSWAYYVTLCGLVLFVLFESKRTQRIIPIMEKPKNTTLEFVQVVGNLYFNYKNHKVIAEKKITFFLEFLRLHYYEQTQDLDLELQERIAAKSGVAQAEVNALFNQIAEIKKATRISEQQLIKLNNRLEDFYRQAGK